MAEDIKQIEPFIDPMKRAAAALRDNHIRFVLAGGLAGWARGGPPSDHDIDFLIKTEDAERAKEALEAIGMRTEAPPEGWLFKAFEDEAMIDVIFQTSDGPVTDEMLERAPEIEVMAMPMRVASLEDVMVTKLLALSEQEPNLGSVLELARAVREQIDWDEVRERTKDGPFAKAFFTLVEELEVVPRA